METSMIAIKSRISLDIEDLDNIINLLDLIGTYKILIQQQQIHIIFNCT